MGNSWNLTEEDKQRVKEGQERILIEMRGYKRAPTIEEVIEGYKKLIQALGGNFVKFMEAYNKALQIGRKYGFIESTLTARIKDFSSSQSNTNNKELDDMFGMEIATPTDLEKEKLILFNELIFKNTKSKIWNKPEEQGGYSAYHSTGYVEIEETEDLKAKIRDIITNSTTEEWKSSKDKNIPPEDRNRISTFKNLQQIIQNPIKLELLTSTMKKMIKEITGSNLNINSIPIIEFHFLTLEKQREAITGRAAHSKYKSGVEEKVKQLFDDEKLFRGINAPWKFEGNEDGVVLQDFYETLYQNWPFLEDSITVRLNEGNGESALQMNKEFDKKLASQFQFLQGYIEGEVCRDPFKQAEIWGQLKTLIMHYRLEFGENKQTLAREVLNILKGGEQK